MDARRVALYCRVSTDEQAQHSESISDQLQALRQWAEEHGYSDTEAYLDEGYSARKSFRKRPALRRLLDDVEQDRIRLILFVRMDRWSRNLKDYYKVQEILDAHHCDWNAITEQFSTDSTEGRFFLNLKLSLAEREADVTGDRIKFVFAQKRARGELISGQLPHGYISVNKRPVKDERYREGLEVFFREFLEHGQARPAMVACNEAGGGLTANHAGNILRASEKYTGLIQNCQCEPYITWEEHLRIQQMRRRRERYKKSGEVFLFTGFIWCSECGHRYAGHYCRHHLRIGETEENRRHYISYLCSHRQNSGLVKCHNSCNINERDIEAHLMEHLDDALLNRIIEIEEEQTKSGRTDPEADERKIARLEQRKTRGWEAYLDGIVDKETFETERRRIDEEISAIMVKQQEETHPPSTDAILKAVPNGWRDIYAELDKEHRRMFWYNAISRITIHPDRSIDFSLAF